MASQSLAVLRVPRCNGIAISTATAASAAAPFVQPITPLPRAVTSQPTAQLQLRTSTLLATPVPIASHYLPKSMSPPNASPLSPTTSAASLPHLARVSSSASATSSSSSSSNSKSSKDSKQSSGGGSSKRSSSSQRSECEARSPEKEDRVAAYIATYFKHGRYHLVKRLSCLVFTASDNQRSELVVLKFHQWARPEKADFPPNPTFQDFAPDEAMNELRCLELVGAELTTPVYDVLARHWIGRDIFTVIVTPLYSMDLAQWVANNRSQLNGDKIQSWMRDILMSITFAHLRDVVHRDIKPHNIFLSTDGSKAVLADWNSAREFIMYDTDDPDGGHMTKGRCTIWYRAPEIAAGQPYKFPVDVYSAGCVFYEWVVGRPLFTSYTEIQLLTDMVDEWGASAFPFKLPFTPKVNSSSASAFPKIGARRNKWPNHTGWALARDLFEHMVDPNPNTRYDAATCLNHPYFNSLEQQIIAAFKEITSAKQRVIHQSQPEPVFAPPPPAISVVATSAPMASNPSVTQ